jgi:NADH-quinone oxidoreductase subunit M
MNRFHIFQITTALALWGVVISAVYMLRLPRDFPGPLADRWAATLDLRTHLRWQVGLLVAASLWIGFSPQTFVQILTPAFRNYFSASK